MTAILAYYLYCSASEGAWVSDRLLGAKRTLFYSAYLVTAGHTFDLHDEPLYLLVLGGPAIGVGLVVVALTPMIKRLAPAVA